MKLLIFQLVCSCQFMFPLRQLFASSSLRRLIVPRRPSLTMMSSTATARGEKKVIILAGATSSGKSAASMELAKRLGNVEIVIADSVQVYRHLDIVANKPTLSDMAAIPHHLVDISEPRDTLSAGDFCELAAEKISDIIARGNLPVIVGGSTMWIKWLINGVPDAPIGSEYAKTRSVELLQNAHANKDWPAALSILRDSGSTMVDKLSANDWYRAHRYLEIAIDLESKAQSASASSATAAPTTSGLSNVRKPVLADYDVRSFFLMEEDRELLFHTIDKRCEMMLDMGMIQEVGNLLLQGILVPEAVVWKSIGYRRTIQYLLDPNIEPKDVDAFMLFLSDFAAETRAYARKQHKYYRKDTSLLFVNINRKQNSSHSRDQILPYQQVALEILHWTYDRDRSAYELMIHEQCQAAQFVAKWRKKKTFSPIDVENKLEFKAICSLIRSEELALDVSTQDTLAKWSQLCQDHGVVSPLPNTNSKKRSRSPSQEGIPSFEEDPLLRSAANPKIRAEESTQKMKAYVSHIPTPNTPNSRLHPREEIEATYSKYVPIADEFRARLRTEKPDLWLQFFPVDGNQVVSDNDS